MPANLHPRGLYVGAGGTSLARYHGDGREFMVGSDPGLPEEVREAARWRRPTRKPIDEFHAIRDAADGAGFSRVVGRLNAVATGWQEERRNPQGEHLMLTYSHGLPQGKGGNSAVSWEHLTRFGRRVQGTGLGRLTTYLGKLQRSEAHMPDALLVSMLSKARRAYPPGGPTVTQQNWVRTMRAGGNVPMDVGVTDEHGFNAAGWSAKGEWRCPECSTTIGKNLLGEKPFRAAAAHLKTHGTEPADYGMRRSQSDPLLADMLSKARYSRVAHLHPGSGLNPLREGIEEDVAALRPRGLKPAQRSVDPSFRRHNYQEAGHAQRTPPPRKKKGASTGSLFSKETPDDQTLLDMRTGAPANRHVMRSRRDPLLVNMLEKAATGRRHYVRVAHEISQIADPEEKRAVTEYFTKLFSRHHQPNPRFGGGFNADRFRAAAGGRPQKNIDRAETYEMRPVQSGTRLPKALRGGPMGLESGSKNEAVHAHITRIAGGGYGPGQAKRLKAEWLRKEADKLHTPKNPEHMAGTPEYKSRRDPLLASMLEKANSDYGGGHAPYPAKRVSKRMSMRQFITENREMIDAHITRKVPNIGKKLDHREREMWIANDEDLYNAARAAGVKV